MLSQTDGAKMMVKGISEINESEGHRFFAGKLGTSELTILNFYVSYRKDKERKLPYPPYYVSIMTLNAGFFPGTEEQLDKWSEYMINDVLPNMDIVVEWNPNFRNDEKNILSKYALNSIRVPLRSLEPYYEDDVSNIWSANIPSGSIVGVVSPFAKSIETQWIKRDLVWNKRKMWSDNLKLVTIQAGYSPELSKVGCWDSKIANWKEAVDSVVEQCIQASTQIVIVGCGSLSLPICAELKKNGISAIHLGGATQILFGIKGRRWANHPIISYFFNKHWVHVRDDEIPTNAIAVENGCYW